MILALLLQVVLSVVEVYCERVRDLLAPDKDNLQVLVRRYSRACSNVLPLGVLPLGVLPLGAFSQVQS